jgi:ankyrin repeat protein
MTLCVARREEQQISAPFVKSARSSKHSNHSPVVRADSYKQLFDQAYKECNVAQLENLQKQNPEHFTTLVTSQNQYGWTHLMGAVKNQDLAMVKLFAKFAPGAIKIPLIRRGISPVYQAVLLGNVEMVQALLQASPEAALLKNTIGNTPLHLAAEKKNLQLIKSLAEAAPKALAVKNRNCNTPLRISVLNNHLEGVECMALAAPDLFKRVLAIGDAEGYTLFHLAINVNVEMAKFMASKAPEALSAQSKYKETAFYWVKTFRPNNYQTICKLYKQNQNFVPLISFHKEQFRRVGIGHAWHIAGNSTIEKVGIHEGGTDVTLEYHASPHWYHLMRKHFNQFIGEYPEVVNLDMPSIMQIIFDFGADFDTYSLDDIVTRIKSGMPTIIPAGDDEHEVTVLIWGHHIVICDREKPIRSPIEIYLFNNLLIDSKIVSNMLNAYDYKDYKKLFYEELPRKLQFSQTAFYLELEKVENLVLQTVSNCTFLNSITAIYGLILLGFVCEINSDGRLKDLVRMEFKNLHAVKKAKALSLYQCWFSSLQLSFLERILDPYHQPNYPFKPDHKLLQEALHKAHLLPLDTQCQKKLDGITKSYIDLLTAKEQPLFRKRLLDWQKAPRQPLL